MGKSYSSIKAGWVNPENYNKKKTSYKDLKASDYDYGVDEEYINAFYKDLQKYQAESEKDYNGVDYGSDVAGLYDKHYTTISELRNRANNIKAYLNANKKNIASDSYSTLIDSIDSIGSSLEDTSKAFQKKKDFFTTFETKYDYDSYLLNNTSGFDGDAVGIRKGAYDSISSRIAELDTLINNHKPDNERTIQWTVNDAGIPVPYWDVRDKNQSKLDSLINEKEKLEAELRKYDHGKKDTDELYTKYSANEDWEEDSQSRNLNTPNERDLGRYGTVNIDTGELWDIDESSVTMEDPLGTYLAYYRGEDGYDYGAVPEIGIPIPTSAEEDTHALKHVRAYNEAIQNGLEGKWEYLYKDEINVYYYMMNNGLEEEALSYLDGMKTELDRRATVGMQNRLEDANALELIFHNVVSIPANIIGGATAFVDDAINTVMGNEINPYSGGHAIQNYAQGVRTATANDINAATGASSSDFITWGDAYQALMSAADSVAGAVVMGGGYSIIMGMGAASSEAKELYEKGASQGQIISGGLLAGAAEAAFEKVSIGYFLDNVLGAPSKSVGKWFVKMLGQAGVEASEEFATTVANYISDAAVMGSRSDFEEIISKYKKQGLTDSEAIWKAIKHVGGEALHDAAVGAISGGLMGGVGGGVSSINYAVEQNAINEREGKRIIDAGGVDALKTVALEYAEELGGFKGKKLTKSANAITNDSSAKDVGAFSEKVGTARGKLNKSDIKSALVKKGLNEDKAENYANILVAMNEEYFKGDTDSLALGTDEQWQRITGDKNAYSVLSEVVTDKESTVNKRNAKQAYAQNGIRIDENGKLNKKDVEAYQERMVAKVTAGGLASNTENTQEFSDDGNTYAEVDGEQIEVTKKLFVNSEDGKLNIKVNDDKVVGVDKVSYGDIGEAYVVSSIVDMGVGAEDANFLHSMFNGKGEKAGKAFANGISLAFKYGRYMQSSSKLADIVGITKSQAEAAYKIGKKSRSTEAKASKAELNEVAETNKNEGKKAQTKGSVVFEGNIADENGNLAAGEDSLTDIQKASVNGVKLIAELTPLNFHFFQSTKDGNTFTYVKQNGQKTHANGWYKVGTNDIYIDLNAGQDGQGTIMYTAAHEISHFIKQFSPEKWNEIAEYVMNEYTKHYGGDVETLLLRQITKVKNRPDSKNKTQREIEDEAFEELVCDSLSKMLIDGTVVEAMANIKQKNKGVWNTIKNAVLKLLEKWSAIIDQYKGRNPDAQEASYFKETTKAFKNLQKMLTEAFVDAGDTYSKVGNVGKAQKETLSGRDTAEESKALKKFGKDLGDVERNSDGDMLVAANEDNSTVMYSERTWNEGGKEKFISLMETLGHGEQAQEYAKYLDDALDYLHELAVGYEILGQHLDATITTDIKNGKQVLSAIVNNGEYPVNIDLALICKKRVAYMRLMAKMIEDGVFGDVKYDGDAIAEVNGILRKNGFETACLGCFVESRRLQFQTWAETIVQEWNEAVESRNKNAKYFRFADGKAALTDAEIEALESELESGGEKNAKGNLNLGQGSVADKMGRLLDKAPTLARKLTVDDLLTPQGLTALRATDDDLFSLVKQRYGAASPKIVQDYNPYASEIADLTFNFVKNVTGNTVKGAQDYINEAKKEFVNEQPPKSPPKQRKKESDEEFKARKAEYDAKKNAYNAKVEALAMRKYLYSIGGARIQSFSDFMIENVFDYLQIFADLSAKELPMHGYTKEIAAMRLFGMTGAKWNGSLIAHVEKSMGKEYAGLLPASEAKNGNGVLVKVDGKEYCIAFDDYARNKATNGKSFIQSIGMKDIVALMYDPRYSQNVGNITIGVSDKQITAMLDSPLFRMVIPYHASGMLPQFAQLVGVDMYNDYTNYQNTTVKEVRLLDGVDYRVEIGDTGKPVVKNANGDKITIDTHYAFNENLQKYGDARKTCQDYLAWCRNDHAIYDKGKLIGYATFNPKFSDSPTGVDFTKHRNYYKLIEDFNTYDNITENASQQGAVTMTFPSAENRLTAEQKKAYEKALRDTGIFTDEDIKKYLEKADMTFEDIVRAEVGNRKAYNDAQEPKFQSTVKEVEDFLLNAKDENGNYKFRRDSYADTASDYLEGKKQGISLKPAQGSYLDDVKLEDRMLPQNYVDSLLDGFGITNPGDYQQVQKRVMSTLVSEGFFTNQEERSRTDVNDESGLHIVTNKSGIDETFNEHNYRNIGRWRKFAKLATIRRLPEIIRDGHVVMNDAPNMYVGPETNKTFAYIEHTLEEAGKRITVKLDIKKSPQKNKFWVHKAIDIKSVSGFPASTDNGTEAGQTTADTVDMVTHPEEKVKENLSDRDSTGKVLTEEQLEFFKDSKVLDEDGNLLVLYHGTQNGGFNIFNPKYSDDGISLFFTDSTELAETYSDSTEEIMPSEKKTGIAKKLENPSKGKGKKGLYKSYLNLKNPLVIDGKGRSWKSIPYGNTVGVKTEMFNDGDNIAFERTIDGKKETKTFSKDEILDATRQIYKRVSQLNESGADSDTSGKLFKDAAESIKGNQFVEFILQSYNTPSSIEKQIKRAKSAATSWETQSDESLSMVTQDDLLDAETRLPVNYTTRDIAKIAKEQGHDGVIIKNIVDTGAFVDNETANNSAQNVYIAFESNQVKSVYNTNPTSDPDIRYSDRTTTSTRSLLANALESTIDTSTQEGQYELKKLNEYKDMVGTLDELNAKLNELRSSLFTKGITGAERRRIQDEATKTANRISVYDKKLLTLEASKPLKKVLDREKAQAAKRQKAKDAKDFKAYKDEMKQKQKEREDKLRESRTAAIEKVRETRDKNEAKAKLQKLVLETAKWISYPKKEDVKCPDFLRVPYATFLGSIDFSSKTLLETGEKTKNDEKMALAMHNLAEAINKVRNAQNPATDSNEVLDSGYLDLPAKFVDDLRELAAKAEGLIVDGDFVINRMSSTDIKSLAQLVRTLNHSIREMSTLYANARFARVEELGDNTISFMEDIGDIESTNAVSDSIVWDNALPYYAFKRFGKGGESVFEGLMDAQDKLAFLADEIIKFREKAWTDKEAKAWSEDTHTIELPSGKTLTLTTADAMSIYCLARRDNNQGLNHLVGGGVRVIGKKDGSKEAKDSRANLDLNDVVAICESLDSRQIEVAEAIQEFMSTVCSEWGNEISMKRFLTKDFTEKRYFPIQSNDEVLAVKDPQAQQSDLFRLLNISATKPLTPNANNSVIIRNIFDVFTEHTSDMARLNSYGMALLDYMKWLNYNEKTKNDDGQITVRGVRPAMNNAYGKKALSYAINLVKDINGRFNDGGDHPWLMKTLRAAKTAAVGSSLRVAALQLTSFPRAAMVLSTGDLVKGLSKKPQISKAKKYCGVALWKSFGFYDTNISRSIEDQIKGTTNWKQKLIELSLKGAEWGDAIAWGYLWNACEYDVAASNKQLKVGTEEFNQAVGKRLRDVVYSTQVVDSVLTRSQNMRNKGGLTQTATAFMSEPTLTANILMDAGFQFHLEKRRTGSAKAAWEKTGGHIIKTATVFGSTSVIIAIVESLVDAYRDDDDEEFLKKFGDAMVSNLVSDVLIFNKIPFLSDLMEGILSWFDLGYFSTDRLDTTWLSDIVKAGNSWKSVLGEAFGSKNTPVTIYKALYDTVEAVSSTTGVAFSGILRELVTLWNNTAGAANPELKIKKYDK